MNEIIQGLSFEEYCQRSGVNYSHLKVMGRSPLAYKWNLDNPKEPTPPMILGRAAHAMILEPETIGNFAVWGEADEHGIRRGKVWEAFQAESAGKQIITAEERDLMVGMSVSVRKSAHIRKYLEGLGDNELSLFWHDTVLGMDMKGRIDRLNQSHGCIVDLKTCRDCRPHSFGGAAYKLGYHMQMAMYQDGYHKITGDLLPVKIIAVENAAPHEAAIYNVPLDVLQQGHEDYMKLCEQLLECQRTNSWPAALETETDLTLPTWAYGERGDDLSDLALVG